MFTLQLPSSLPMPLPDDEYLRHDATGLAELVRRGEVSPLELVETAIARIERLNPRLNAVIHRMDETARALARHGRRNAVRLRRLYTPAGPSGLGQP